MVTKMNITDEINKFREAVCTLWNTYLIVGADWETVELFREICRIIFFAKITSNLDFDLSPIPDAIDGCDYLPHYRVAIRQQKNIDMLINRDIPPSGYWDYPLGRDIPTKDLEIRPINFFDFDVIGWRYFEFYRIRVVSCGSSPEIEGRDALVRCDQVEIIVDAKRS